MGVWAMNLQRLSYALAVAEHGHFGRAATSLGIRQPALSQQIRALENELGVRLFERNARGVEPTAAGEAFLPDAQRALAAAETRAAQRADRGEVGRLAIGFVASAMFWILPKILRAFRTRYPQVELVVHELASGEQAKLLVDGTLDVGLLRPPLPGEREREFVLQPVTRETLVVAVPADSPLALQKSVAIGDLSDSSFIVIPRHLEPASHQQLITLCRDHGFDPHIAAQVPQVHSILGMVAAGLGVAIGPSSLTRYPRDDVTYLPVRPSITIPNLTLASHIGNKSVVRNRFEHIVSEVTGFMRPQRAR
jgi:DNA-binding transcriptional LysR family regulator